MSKRFDVISNIVMILENQATGHGQCFLNEWYPHVNGVDVSDEGTLLSALTGYWRTKIALLGVDNAHDLFNWLDPAATPQAWCSTFAEHIAPNLTFELTSGGWM